MPLVIPADLRSQVAKIARKAKAKQAEVYRLAIRCGLKEAAQRLVAEPDCLFLERRREIARKVVQSLAFVGL